MSIFHAGCAWKTPQGDAPMAEAMTNCQKGMAVVAMVMLSRFHGTMGLSRSSSTIFQPSSSCRGNLGRAGSGYIMIFFVVFSIS